MRRAISAFRDRDLSAQDGLRWLGHACITAAHLWEYDTWEVLATRFGQRARHAGALTMLPLALSQRIAVHVFLGELAEAASLHEELKPVTEATGDPLPPIATLLLARLAGPRNRGPRTDPSHHRRGTTPTAHKIFTTIGAKAFAQRAAGELRATGETARKRTVETSSELTAQEAQIARLVREGLSNPEIGSRLFISPRTVEWRLSRIFGKLNINSRRQLHVSA